MCFEGCLLKCHSAMVVPQGAVVKQSPESHSPWDLASAVGLGKLVNSGGVTLLIHKIWTVKPSSCVAEDEAKHLAWHLMLSGPSINAVYNS